MQEGLKMKVSKLKKGHSSYVKWEIAPACVDLSLIGSRGHCERIPLLFLGVLKCAFLVLAPFDLKHLINTSAVISLKKAYIKLNE